MLKFCVRQKTAFWFVLQKAPGKVLASTSFCLTPPSHTLSRVARPALLKLFEI